MKKRAREILCTGLFLMFLTCGVAHATYVTGDVWDFKTDFSSSQRQVQDKEHNIVWEYRGGAIGQAPSSAVLLSTPFDSTANAWIGATDPHSWIGKGFMKACWDFGGTGDLNPLLVWDSNIKGTIDVDIKVTNASQRFRAIVFHDDTLDVERSGSTADYSVLRTFSVKPGEKISLRIESDSLGMNPLMNVDFKVTATYVESPEPMTMTLMALGAGGLVWRRRSKV